jgi:hypothetical protein
MPSFRNMILVATFACITTWILYTALRGLLFACFHATEAKRLGCPCTSKESKGASLWYPIPTENSLGRPAAYVS